MGYLGRKTQRVSCLVSLPRVLSQEESHPRVALLMPWPLALTEVVTMVDTRGGSSQEGLPLVDLDARGLATWCAQGMVTCGSWELLPAQWGSDLSLRVDFNSFGISTFME